MSSYCGDDLAAVFIRGENLFASMGNPDRQSRWGFGHRV
jgi:hypothetical protein